MDPYLQLIFGVLPCILNCLMVCYLGLTGLGFATLHRGRRGVGSNADEPVQPKEGQASMPEIKTSNPGTLGALESFTPSPPRLSVLPAADRWGDSKIPRSPLAKSPAASSCVSYWFGSGKIAVALCQTDSAHPCGCAVDHEAVQKTLVLPENLYFDCRKFWPTTSRSDEMLNMYKL